MYEKELKEVGEKLAKKTAEIETVLGAAITEDNRQLTEDERGRVDALEAETATLRAEQERLEADRQRFSRQSERKTFLKTPMARITEPTKLSNTLDPSDVIDSAVIRARRTTANLRGFPDARTAYLSGLWACSELFGHQGSRDFLSRNAPQYLSMSEGQDSSGGVLVPTEFHNAIIMLLEQYGTARKKCDIAPMASDTATWPKWLSGITTYFVGEEKDITDSTPKMSNVSLTARKLAAMTKLSSELSEDSAIDIASLLSNNFAYGFAVKEDQCLFLGTGTSTYGGISGLITALKAATASTVTAATGNTAFSTLDLTDFESMIGKLPEFPGISPEWYISKAGWAASMMRLADAAGGVTASEIEGKRTQSFLGYPVNFVQCMNSTLTAQTSTYGLCYFGDLRMAVTFGDRRSIRMEVLRELYAVSDQIGIKGTERFDINCHDVGDTSNAGAVIMLATPSS